MTRRVSMALLALALLCGCDGKRRPAARSDGAAPAAAPDAAVATDPSEAEIERMVARGSQVLDQLGDAMAANTHDCGKMAAAIEAVVAEHQTFLADARRWKGNPAAEQKVQQAMVASGVLDRTQQKMMAAFTACGADRRIEAAMQKMDL